jgi:hypothetical protein
MDFACGVRTIGQAAGLDGKPIEAYFRLAKDCPNNMWAMLQCAHCEIFDADFSWSRDLSHGALNICRFCVMFTWARENNVRTSLAVNSPGKYVRFTPRGDLKGQ